MQLGMIGVGRMGANMVRRLVRAGHECVAHDVDPAAVAEVVADGAIGSAGLDDFVARLHAPRAIWIMVPAAFVDGTLAALVPLLDAGDVVVDGGNSHYVDDLRRGHELAGRNVHYVDVGTSGGVFGRDRGFCMMVGGDEAAVVRLAPLLDDLAPGVAAAPRTPGREGEPAPEERGWLHCGPSGAGHFVKMVHNGIEYGLMAAYAEGLNILHNADVGLAERAKDAETTPLRQPELYQYSLDLPAITELWRRGSVISSWLLDLTAFALRESPRLEGFGGRVADSGEGRWTLQAAVEAGVPAHVLSAAVFDRFASRDAGDFANRVLSAMRLQFGGHVEQPAAGEG